MMFKGSGLFYNALPACWLLKPGCTEGSEALGADAQLREEALVLRGA